LLTVSICIYSEVPGVHSWGGDTHRFIAENAIELMPDNFDWFFSAYSNVIIEYSTKPDQWKYSDPYEQYRHWYHVDIPHDESDYANGVLPWAVEDNFNTFVQYLRENDWDNAAQLAGVICHYIGDASNPLHATSDYNPGGNHTAFESTVNYHLGEMNMDMPGFVPQELENVFSSTIQLLEESYGYTGYTPDKLNYWLAEDNLWNDTVKGITENRLRSAVQFLANIWYTGMVQATPPERGVQVSISPGENYESPGENVTFEVTVKNIGATDDNYLLENADNSGWPIQLENSMLEVPAGENRTTTLTITIPDNAVQGTVDNIFVTATSQTDNTVSDSDSCIAHAAYWTGTVTFKLENLYKVSLGKDLQLYIGSKLVVKFYTYDSVFENQSVIHENFALPWRVVPENENVAHPGDIGVKMARLDLTYDDAENVISTIASFTVTRGVLASRYIGIKSDYVKPGADKPALAAEYLKVKSQYANAP